MDTGSILQGIGLFVCIGAIVLVALIAFAVRALTRGRSTNDPTMWNTRGEESPRYDDPKVESRGGFGNVPNTGRADVFDSDEQRGGFGGKQSQRSTRRRDRADDDDIRSSSGFGGG